MQKPSERIKEIAMRGKKIGYSEHDQLQAIITYLDETWEAEQPCKHEEILQEKSFHSGKMIRSCKKCGGVLAG